MSLPRYAAMRDYNELGIIDCLMTLGFVCERLSASGLPDVLASRRGIWYLIEIKSQYGKLTPSQVKFHKEHSAPITIIRSIDDAIAFSKCNP